MGGHGGLNILPQKRWNVYNFENREKVRKDEEEAAREEAIRQQKARREDTEFKLEKLREAAKSKRRRVEQGSSDLQEGSDSAIVVRGTVLVEGILASNGDSERPRHLNLFPEYEQREKEGQGMVQERDKERKRGSGEKDRRKDFQDHRDRQLEKKDGKPTGEPADDHYRLGHGAHSKNGKKPWYMMKSFMVGRTHSENEGRLDTKVQVADNLDHQSSKSSKSKKSLEDLRAERLAREHQERGKARKVVLAQAGGSFSNTRLADGRTPRYHASFGNARV